MNLFIHSHSPPFFNFIYIFNSKIKSRSLKNKNWFGLLLMVFFNAQMLHAQITKDSSKMNDVKSILKFKISWNIGPEWEQEITKTSSINFFVGPSFGKAVDGFSFSNYKAKWIISPAIFSEYRNYYNLHRRKNQQKKTRNNSANFLFGRVEVFLPVKNQNYLNLLFIQGVGVQRCLIRKITIDGHLGIIEHVYYDKPPQGGFNYIKIEPLLIFSLNYVF